MLCFAGCAAGDVLYRHEAGTCGKSGESWNGSGQEAGFTAPGPTVYEWEFVTGTAVAWSHDVSVHRPPCEALGRENDVDADLWRLHGLESPYTRVWWRTVWWERARSVGWTWPHTAVFHSRLCGGRVVEAWEIVVDMGGDVGQAEDGLESIRPNHLHAVLDWRRKDERTKGAAKVAFPGRSHTSRMSTGFIRACYRVASRTLQLSRLRTATTSKRL